MKMETNEDSCDSLPYIDDVPMGDEDIPQQYNLKISENYRNKNRDIEITNRSSNDIAEYFAPKQPEPNDFQQTEARRQMRSFATSGMKLVIKGCNSSISIQGLDNKSSITFKRRCGKLQKEVEVDEKTAKAHAEESRPKRRRWKMLTKSLMLARAARFERRGIDERYPKYVLLKNEDEDVTKVKENYPKMFLFNERKQKGSSAFKSDFNLKKSFKNKTEPIVPLEEILPQKTEERQNRKSGEIVKPKQKQPLTDRPRSENKNHLTKSRNAVERRKSLKPNERRESAGCPLPQSFVCGEIQGIFEDALKLLPQHLNVQQPDGTPQPRIDPECDPGVPTQFYHIPCPDQYCCLGPPDQTPGYIPLSCPPRYLCKNADTQTCQYTAERNEGEGDEDLENLPFRLLSDFFPRVVIMNTIRSEDLRVEEGKEGAICNGDFYSSRPEIKDSEPQKEDEVKGPEDLQIQQDPALESTVVRQATLAAPEDSFLSDFSLKESSDEELKTKTQESEATTEYLHYDEFIETTENEAGDPQKGSTPPPRYESKETALKSLSSLEKYKTQNGEDNFENLSLTKVGYKMYDNLTKLSLNREKDAVKRPEASGCGCNGNETKKSPCNITFESSSSVVKVTVPENELNFQIVNSLGADIQIGMRSGRRSAEKEEKEGKEGKKILRIEGEKKEEKEIFQEEEMKKIVRKEELWHSDGGGGTVLHNEGVSTADGTAFQKVKVSLADDKAVVLSIEMTEGDKKRHDKTKEKRTKEMKVGTDDFNLAGGDFDCSSGGSHKNLSPRIGRLLKHLHDKLESDERQRKFLDEKINQKLLRQEGVFPGVFLVKHISPRKEVARKTAGVSVLEKGKKLTDKEERSGQLREYYCEDCLATLRIFEDENPSVKSIIDKFETIVQLESY